MRLEKILETCGTFINRFFLLFSYLLIFVNLRMIKPLFCRFLFMNKFSILGFRCSLIMMFDYSFNLVVDLFFYD